MKKRIELKNNLLVSKEISLDRKDLNSLTPKPFHSIDASVQVDFQNDAITHESDGEKVKQKWIPYGGLINKKGHPVYSREDIREQYCINKKELTVFEQSAYHQKKFFGYLSASSVHDKSSFNTASYLLPCVHKIKSSEDNTCENIKNNITGEKKIKATSQEENRNGVSQKPISSQSCQVSEKQKSWSGRKDFAYSNSQNFSPVTSSSCADRSLVSNHLQSSKSLVFSHGPCSLSLSGKEPRTTFSTSKSVDELNEANQKWYNKALAREQWVNTPSYSEEYTQNKNDRFAPSLRSSQYSTSGLKNNQSQYNSSSRLVRRVLVKTQATQTEKLLKVQAHSFPAYLTLSPRASQQNEKPKEEKQSNLVTMSYSKMKTVFQLKTNIMDQDKIAGNSQSIDQVMKQKIEKKRQIDSPTDDKLLWLKDKAQEKFQNFREPKKRSRLKLYEFLTSPSKNKDLILLDTNCMTDTKMEKVYEIKSRSLDKLNFKNDKTDQSLKFRRHSTAADFFSEKVSSLAYPVSEFNEKNCQPKDKLIINKSDVLPVKSSSESIKMLESETNNFDQSFSNKVISSTISQDLPTSINEFSKNTSTLLDEKIISQPKETVSVKALKSFFESGEVIGKCFTNSQFSVKNFKNKLENFSPTSNESSKSDFKKSSHKTPCKLFQNIDSSNLTDHNDKVKPKFKRDLTLNLSKSKNHELASEVDSLKTSSLKNGSKLPVLSSQVETLTFIDSDSNKKSLNEYSNVSSDLMKEEKSNEKFDNMINSETKTFNFLTQTSKDIPKIETTDENNKSLSFNFFQKNRKDEKEKNSFHFYKNLDLDGLEKLCEKVVSKILSAVVQTTKDFNLEKINSTYNSKKEDKKFFNNHQSVIENKLDCLELNETLNKSESSVQSLETTYTDSITSGSFVVDDLISDHSSYPQDLIDFESSHSFSKIDSSLSKEGVCEKSKSNSLENTQTFEKKENLKEKLGQASVTSEPFANKDELNALQLDIAGESSQATEKDLTQSEFSLELQSSQEIDEDLLSECETKLPESEITQGLTESAETSTAITPINFLKKSEVVEQAETQKVLKTTDSNIDFEKIEKEQKEKQDELNKKERVLKEDEDNFENYEKHQVKKKSSDKTSSSSNCTCKLNCNHCSELASHNTQPFMKKRKELNLGIPHSYKKSATIGDILNYLKDDDENIGIYSHAYKSASWFYINRKDEIRVWNQKLMPKNISSNSQVFNDHLKKSNLVEATTFEKEFKKNFEAITHRMIHRRASIDMYNKILDKKFKIDKSIEMKRNSGEFGFRIHGSRPVVVSAIEKGTAAEECGLEVGDIIVNVNDINVIEMSHSEVVRLARSDILRLDLICTCNNLKVKIKDMKEDDEIVSGYLYWESSGQALFFKEQENPISYEWKQRWFILKTDCCLYWYQSSTEVELFGVINLKNCKASLESDIIDNDRYVIRLTSYEGPTHFLSSIEEESAKKWIQHLNNAANNMTKANWYINKTLRNIHIRPLCISDPDCHGYLAIFGHSTKLWKKRYFVLKDACLYSYIDINHSTALGVFYLQGYKVQSGSVIGKKCTFEVIGWDSKEKHLWLMTDSEIDKKRWLAALEYSIDRWMRLN